MIPHWICGMFGHTWECWRTRELKVIGWRCAHCGKFSVTRPSGILDRFYE
jgi:hypothetical protein